MTSLGAQGFWDQRPMGPTSYGSRSPAPERYRRGAWDENSMIWLQPGWKDFVALFIVAVRRQWRACIVFPLALVVGGCFLAPRSPDRPVPTAFWSLAMSVDGCEPCHADTVSRMSATSAHGA